MYKFLPLVGIYKIEFIERTIELTNLWISEHLFHSLTGSLILESYHYLVTCRIYSAFQKQLQIGQLYAFSLFHVLILIAIGPYLDQLQ